MKRAKSPQEIAHHSQQCKKLCEPRARAFEENFVGRLLRQDQMAVRRFGHFCGRRCVRYTSGAIGPNLRGVVFRATFV
jgi:hypothetical protein